MQDGRHDQQLASRAPSEPQAPFLVGEVGAQHIVQWALGPPPGAVSRHAIVRPVVDHKYAWEKGASGIPCKVA